MSSSDWIPCVIVNTVGGADPLLLLLSDLFLFPFRHDSGADSAVCVNQTVRESDRADPAAHRGTREILLDFFVNKENHCWFLLGLAYFNSAVGFVQISGWSDCVNLLAAHMCFH